MSSAEHRGALARPAAAAAAGHVTIVMPALNEEAFIADAIASILPSSPETRYELIVADGGSSDSTRAIVERIAAGNARVRLVANDKRIQSAGVNLGARLARPESRFLVRADCHLRYPENFVERCIATLVEENVASVVVPMRTEGRSCLQRAIAAAQNSRLGNGGSAHRLGGRSGLVEHGHHAAFDLATFRELGGYDETFTHNEDAEFDRRLVRAGGRIYLDSGAAVTYYPRARFGALARQYFSYGWGRAGTVAKHAGWPRARQMLPVAVLAANLAALALSLFDWRFLALPLAYASVATLWGLGLAARHRDPCLALSGPAAIVMHMSWGAGFVAGFVSSLFRKDRSR